MNRREFIAAASGAAVTPWEWRRTLWYSLDNGETWIETGTESTDYKIIYVTLLELQQTVLKDYPCLNLEQLSEQTAFNIRVYGKSTMHIEC
jgi:hypothetical protein